MPSGIYKRKPNSKNGKYIRTPETREKMRQHLLVHPIRYWLGKKIPKDIVEKIKKTKKLNSKEGNKNYFKVHVFKGKNHKLWKGDKVGYDALHTWLYRELGKPDTCEFCEKIGT